MAATSLQRSSFYHYFDDLPDALLQLLDETQIELLASAEPWLTGASEGPAALAEAITRSTEVWVRHRDVLLAVHDGAAHDARIAQRYRAVFDEWAAVTADRLRAERRSGRSALTDPDEIAAALTMMNINVLAERVGRGSGESPRAVNRALIEIWISTIYPDSDGEQSRST